MPISMRVTPHGFALHEPTGCTPLMKPTIDTQDIRWQTDDMNEWVMEEAAPPSQPELEPEVPEVPVWTEPPVIIEQKDTVEGEQSISELLVNAGNEEAVLEQRVSADKAETANAEV
jgi:hypothetical protein